ncbi:MAG: sugar phosphate isomerase/epimerase [Planctomycetes bacterium]|nr:sugar phosphate isomerase/epimerase [Planctomycetota bacterium]
MLRFAYNTNGLQSHRLEDALALLGETGYHGVALTLDHMHLDPLQLAPGEVARVARSLAQRRLRCVVETGARYLLDPRRKHRPTLIDPQPLERMRRVDLLRRSLEVAAELQAEALTLHTGPLDPAQDAQDAQRFLLDGLSELLEKATELGVPLALEPEPGHFVATLAQFEALQATLPELRLTLDVAHVSVEAEEGTPAEALRRYADALAVVHLEDAPRRVHAHLPFGEGELDLPGVLQALVEVGFAGLCAVELSRHSHAAHSLVPATWDALQAALPSR